MSREPTPRSLRRAPGFTRWPAFASATCALAVVALALLVRGDTAVSEMDIAVHERLRAYALAHPPWLSAMAALTHLGDTAVVGAAVIVVLAIAVVRRRRPDAAFVVGAALLAYVLSRALRSWLGRARPEDRLWPTHDPAFPSGHAANSAALAAIVVLLWWPRLRAGGRIGLVAAASAYAMVVGLTRIAGGVHWLSDVLAGWLVAVATVLAVAAAFRVGREIPTDPVRRLPPPPRDTP